MKTIKFLDRGQDFINWDIENRTVVASRGQRIWEGCKILNRNRLKAGDKIRIRTPEGDVLTIKYPIVSVSATSRKQVAL